MSVLGNAAIGAVAVQLAATGALQAFQRNRWVVWLDRAAIVPMWLFFAVDGKVEGWRLLARDGVGDVPLGAWRRVALAPPRGALSALWNPHKHRETQALILLERLARRSAAQPGFDPATAPAYRLLLGLAQRDGARDPAATTRQFAITRSDDSPAEPPRFASRFHPLS